MDDKNRELSKKLHQESSRLYDKEQNALCFIVLGGIALIIGLIFIVLSFRREYGQLTTIDYTSVAFVICVCGLAIGSFCLIYGLIKFFVSFNHRRDVIKKINSLKKEN